MTFFNKKEDVMVIELTPHGRHLLSKGEMKPQYYTFLDDDILYDSEAAGFSENNTQSKVRILTDTPSLKPQTTYTGVESKYFDQITTEDDNVFLNRIGTSRQNSKNANGWEIVTILGEITSSSTFVSSSLGTGKIIGTTSPLYNIPQIECELNHTLSLGIIGQDAYDSDDYRSSEIAEDNTFVKLSNERFIFYILEKNGFLYKDSLSVESYIYDYDEARFEDLHFLDGIQNIKNDILLDERDGIELEGEEGTLDDDTMVETYFNVMTDRAIPDAELCKGIQKLKDKNIYLGLKINCDPSEFSEINIYQTEVSEADIEDCEDFEGD